MTTAPATKLPTWDEPCVRLEDGSYAFATLDWLIGTYGDQGEAEREAERNEFVQRVTTAVVAALGQWKATAPEPPSAPTVEDRKGLEEFLAEFGYEIDDA